jgi:precorrin-6B methylase 2
MKQKIKAFALRNAPRVALHLLSVRSRKHAQRYYARSGHAEIGKRIADRYGDRVLSGPFEGIRLPDESFKEHLAPYLLGVYEAELHAIWETLFAGNYRQVLDIGAKFGYYALGIAACLPHSEVVAFDTDPWARSVIAKASLMNDCRERTVIKGYCGPEWLRDHLQEDALILSDCEGFESVLVDPKSISKLSSAVMVIETHDQEVIGVTNDLIERFAHSHVITEIRNDESMRKSPVDLGFLSENEQRIAISDLRPDQSWLVMLPRTGAHAWCRDLLVSLHS